jgi:allophanate hydrolase subunit 2
VPRKAAWIALETTELEFEHYLAERLGMTVGDMRRRMSMAEFITWSIYYQRKAQRIELERAKAR